MTAVADATMLQDQTGAAVIVGGYIGGGAAVSTIYRLPNAGSSWIQLNQTLRTGHFWHVAFLVPDSVINCATATTTATTTSTPGMLVNVYVWFIRMLRRQSWYQS